MTSSKDLKYEIIKLGLRKLKGCEPKKKKMKLESLRSEDSTNMGKSTHD